MTAAAAHLDDRARGGPWRLALTVVLLLAFALQNYIAQTHFHAPSVTPASAAALQPVKAVPHQGSPAGQDAIACPLCQVAAGAGAFLASSVALATPPAVLTAAVSNPLPIAGLKPRPAGFAWRSRAPPQA